MSDVFRIISILALFIITALLVYGLQVYLGLRQVDIANTPFSGPQHPPPERGVGLMLVAPDDWQGPTSLPKID